jgi:hypothetical protein
MAAFNYAFVKVCWLARNDAVHREPSGDLPITLIQDPPSIQLNQNPMPKTSRKRKRETFARAWNNNDKFVTKHFITRNENDYVVQRPTAPVAPTNRAQLTI